VYASTAAATAMADAQVGCQRTQILLLMDANCICCDSLVAFMSMLLFANSLLMAWFSGIGNLVLVFGTLFCIDSLSDLVAIHCADECVLLVHGLS
jgi:hypothetical protein